jgi:hypothetical protein
MGSAGIGVLAPASAAIVTGFANIRSLTFGAASTYSDDQLLAIFGLTFRVHKTEGWTPTGGQVEWNITSATTAQDVAVAFVAANNAQAGSTHTAATPVAGVTTCTAKLVGSAYNVAASGTATVTEATTQNGADPLYDPASPNTNVVLSTPGSTLTGDGTKPVVVTLAQLAALNPKFLTFEGQLGSAMQTVSAKALLGLTSLACDTLGGFEFTVEGKFDKDPGAVNSIGINGLYGDTEVSGIMHDYAIITAGAAVFQAGAAYATNASAGIGMQAGGTARGWFNFLIRCKRPSSLCGAQRRFEVEYAYLYNSDTNVVRARRYDVMLNEVGTFAEIDDVSLRSSTADMWPAIARWSFRGLP